MKNDEFLKKEGFSKLKEALFKDLLNNCSIKDIIITAEKYLHNPITVLESDYCIMASTDDLIINNSRTMRGKNYLSEHFISHLETIPANGSLKTVIHSRPEADSNVLSVSASTCFKVPIAVCPILINNVFFGWVMIIGRNVALSEAQAPLIELLSRVLSLKIDQKKNDPESRKHLFIPLRIFAVKIKGTIRRIQSK